MFSKSRPDLIKNFGKIRQFGLTNGPSLFEDLAKNCGMLIGITDGENDRFNEYNAINNGTTFQMADKYAEVIAADTNNILYDVAGDPKVLTIASIPNITDNQFFFDNTSGRVLFFTAPLTGDCEIKAEKFLYFNQTVEVEEGILGVDEGKIYVAKEGVTQA